LDKAEGEALEKLWKVEQSEHEKAISTIDAPSRVI